MELRQYWRIFSRRLWLPLILMAVAAASALLFQHPIPPQFEASARVIVDLPPLPAEEGMGFDPRLTAPQATEYLIDDFNSFVGSDVVAQEVSRRLSGQGIQVPAGAIYSSTSSQKIHRTIDLKITWPDAEQAKTIMLTLVTVVQEEAPSYFARLDQHAPKLALISGPSVSPIATPLTRRLDVPIRLLLALIAGIALVFLWDYFDNSVRDHQELEKMGIPVLAVIPKKRLFGR